MYHIDITLETKLIIMVIAHKNHSLSEGQEHLRAVIKLMIVKRQIIINYCGDPAQSKSVLLGKMVKLLDGH